MHSIKKIVSGVSLTAMLLSTALPMNVMADSVQVENNSIRLFGKTECAESGHTVCVDVWAKDKGIADLREADRDEYADIIVYRNETESQDEGVYEIIFSLGDRKSGIYDAYISCDCGEAIKVEKVVHSNLEENKMAIELLNEAAKAENSVSEVRRVCDEYSLALGFLSEYELDNYAAELMIAEIKENALDPGNKTQAIALYEKAVAISAIKSKDLINIFDASNELQLAESDLAELYTKSYATDTLGAYIAKKLTEQTFENFNSFDEKLNEQFLIGVVKYADGWGDVCEVVSELLGRNITRDQAIKIMNKEYDSAADIEEALALSGSAGGGTGGSAGGAGGSGGSGGGNGIIGASQYSSEYVNGDEADKINKNIFDDIDDVPWATESIVELAQKGIISGKAERLFFPNDNITREEFVKIIMLTFFENAEVPDVNFDDVDNSAWYAKYVKQAFGNGIINGIGDNLFGTGMNITREDMAVIAYRTAVAAGKIEESETESDFKFEDDYDIADYAKNAVYSLYEEGVINGVTLESFAPKQELTRAQAAKVVYFIYTL